MSPQQVKRCLLDKQSRCTFYHGANTCYIDPLTENQTVRVRKRWVPATVVRHPNNPQSYWVRLTNGDVVRCNRTQIKTTRRWHANFLLCIIVSTRLSGLASLTRLSLSLPLISLSGVRAARNFATASSDSLFHPPLSPVFLFQFSSSPAFFTSLHSPPISTLTFLVSSCPPHVTLPFTLIVCRPPSILRVLPAVACS